MKNTRKKKRHRQPHSTYDEFGHIATHERMPGFLRMVPRFRLAHVADEPHRGRCRARVAQQRFGGFGEGEQVAGKHVGPLGMRIYVCEKRKKREKEWDTRNGNETYQNDFNKASQTPFKKKAEEEDFSIIAASKSSTNASATPRLFDSEYAARTRKPSSCTGGDDLWVFE